MAVFGKVLLFLNILAAIGFLVLASMEWGKRTEAQYQAFRGQLVIHGLPLDDKDPGFRNPDDGPLVNEFGTRVLSETFSGANGGSELGGGQVKTLKEEVERVKNKVSSNISSAANPTEKAAYLRKYLLDQVRDGQTRDDLAQRLENPAELEKLEAELNKLFDDALATNVPTAPSESKALDDKQQKREQIAHLLIHLAPRDPEWQQRVAAVIGLKTYIPVLDRQSVALAAMADRARMILRRDQNTFLGEYQSLLAQSRTQADRLADADRSVEREKNLLNEHAVTAAELKKRVTEYEELLRQSTEKTQTSLKQQGEMEKRIYDVLADIVRTQDRIAQLEHQLRDLEQQARPVNPNP